jgi:hypothetical protein
MGRARGLLAGLQWRWTLARLQLAARTTVLTATVLAVAYLAAVLLEASWTLRFSHVLAWPVVALVALIAFRLPLSRMFQGQTVKRLSIGPATLELQQDATNPSEGLAAHEPEEATQRVIFVLGTLTQIYQMQINFLRQLRQAADGLSGEAALDWMRAATQNPDAPTQIIEPLLRWLVDRGLVSLRADGHYLLEELGRVFLDDIEGFWYAPKAV